MKQVYFLLTFLFLFSFIHGQIVPISDYNFKDALIGTTCADFNGNGFPDGDVDTNNDGEIQVAEAEAVLGLYISNSTIYGIDGIEAFTNLQTLDCSGNYIENIYGYMPDLTELYLGGNSYGLYISLDNYPSLQVLSLYNTRTGTLDLSSVPNLTELDIMDCNFTSLDLSPVSNLTYLDCSLNQISSLDLSPVTYLTDLFCAVNQITSLDVSELTSLESLSCGFNELSTLDISANPALNFIDCRNNPLSTLFLKNGNTINYYNILNTPDLLYICVNTEDIELVQDLANNSSSPNCVVNSYCSFTPGGTYYTVEGQVRYDLDTNGCDTNDSLYPNLRIDITDGSVLNGVSIADVSGDYSIPVQEGIHTFTPLLENLSYWMVSPASFIADFPTDASPYIQDICIVPSGIYDDLEVVVIPETGAVPGFDAEYEIIYKNKGTTTLSGSVALAFQDELMDFVSANPAVNTQSTGNLSWDFTDLEPFESRVIDVIMNINTPMESPPVEADDVLTFTTTVTHTGTEETPDDNTFVLNQTVVNSYDPNDKTCLEGATVTEEKIGAYVHYLIRFENTGTAEAVNIVVKDEIDAAKFDVSTLIPLHGSHTYYTRVTGDVVEFIFENINLPFDDANNDGYVAFKIKTLPTLQIGDTFENDVEIYFDYNFPILTNVASTEIVDVLSVSDFGSAQVKVYPNPATDLLTIDSAKGMIQSIRITDVNGRVVLVKKTDSVNTETIDLSRFGSGMYFINVTTSVGSQTVKVVKE